MVKKGVPGIYKSTSKQVEAENTKKRNLVIGGIAAIALLLAVGIAFGINNPGKQAAKTTLKTSSGTQTNATSKVNSTSKQVTMQTSQGEIVLEIFPKLMPKTVQNFEKLINSQFYNGLTFHRVEDWVIQGGDPKGNGSGGPGWTIPLETNPQLTNVRGALAMARSTDPNSAGSQFYILKKDAPSLNGQYAVFGKVIKGMDVVDKIKIGDKMVTVKE